MSYKDYQQIMPYKKLITHTGLSGTTTPLCPTRLILPYALQGNICTLRCTRDYQQGKIYHKVITHYALRGIDKQVMPYEGLFVHLVIRGTTKKVTYTRK